MDKLKVLDLFSGIGGFSLGMERTGGFETVAFCEIDEHCHKVLNKHWPEVPIFEDVSNLRWNPNHIKIDVICGGFPCQDISVAGKQKGLIDEASGQSTRSGLWFEYKRLIEEIKPKWVVIENVRNLLSNGLGTVLQDLSEIGYDAEWEIISARDVGACHLRERVWIVAYPNRTTVWNEVGELPDNRRTTRRSGKESLRQEYRKTQNVELRTSCSESIPETLAWKSEGFGVEGLRPRGEQVSPTHDEENVPMCSSEISPNTNDFRFWPTFTSEEEKQQWWAEATSSIRDWWEIESSVCRVDDELSGKLDKGRAQRIKQLGNAVVPAIPQIIAERILFHEAIKCL